MSSDKHVFEKSLECLLIYNLACIEEKRVAVDVYANFPVQVCFVLLYSRQQHNILWTLLHFSRNKIMNEMTDAFSVMKN